MDSRQRELAHSQAMSRIGDTDAQRRDYWIALAQERAQEIAELRAKIMRLEASLTALGRNDDGSG